MAEMFENFNIKDAFFKGVDYFMQHEILSYCIIGVVLVLIIIVIAISAKRRPKKEKKKAKKSKGEGKEIAKISVEEKKEISGKEIHLDGYDLILRTEASVVKRDGSDDIKKEKTADEVKTKENIQEKKTEPRKDEQLVMEKIEIIKSAPAHKYGPGNTNTTRSGRVFTEEELMELIRK